MGNEGFLLHCDWYFGEPLELHKGSRASFCISTGNLGLLSRCCRGKGPHLILMVVSLGFSSCFGFLSGCDVVLWESLMLLQESQAAFRVAMGNLGISLELLQGNMASSRVEA